MDKDSTLTSSSDKPKIFVFCNSQTTDFFGDRMGAAIAEDGQYLAGHVSSNESFLQHDMGVTGTWKHDRYAEHYPDGYEIVYVPLAERGAHAGLQAACKLNETLAKT